MGPACPNPPRPREAWLPRPAPPALPPHSSAPRSGTGTGHGADSGPGARPGKGAGAPGTPHPWRPPSPRPQASWLLTQCSCRFLLGMEDAGWCVCGGGGLSASAGGDRDRLRETGPWDVPKCHPILPGPGKEGPRGAKGASLAWDPALSLADSGREGRMEREGPARGRGGEGPEPPAAP